MAVHQSWSSLLGFLYFPTQTLTVFSRYFKKNEQLLSNVNGDRSFNGMIEAHFLLQALGPEVVFGWVPNSMYACVFQKQRFRLKWYKSNKEELRKRG